MNILILANNDVGLYQFRKELIEALLKENRVLISLPYGGLVEPLKNMGCVYIETPFERRSINPIEDLKLFFRYYKLLKLEKPELVITYTIKPNVYGGFACRQRKIPYVANITGVGTAFERNGLLRKVVTLMYKIGLKNAKTVFFENEENRNIFYNENIVRENQTCLLNGAGVNLEHFQIAEYPEECKITRFLFVGRVMKEKGIEELFEAMQRLRADGSDCTLDIVGSYEEDYSHTIKRYEKEGWLHYYGHQKDVRPFIKNCHCFVLPSWHEGMANTNLECAAMGRPVITSNIHGCLEAVENEVTGFLVDKQNATSLYITMKKFVRLSYAEKKEMGLLGRTRMENNFDKKKVVSKTLNKIC